MIYWEAILFICTSEAYFSISSEIITERMVLMHIAVFMHLKKCSVEQYDNSMYLGK